jgi:hypothetical protein
MFLRDEPMVIGNTPGGGGPASHRHNFGGGIINPFPSNPGQNGMVEIEFLE